MSQTRMRTLQVVALAVVLWPGGLFAQATPESAEACLRCHDRGPDNPFRAFFDTPHATLADERTGFAQRGCATCHGPSLEHRRLPVAAGGSPADIVFTGEHAAAPDEQSRVCLECHAGGELMHWSTGMHAFEDMTCSSCHRIHVQTDPALDRHAQNQACTGCHAQQRTEMHRPFAHPMREGRMACSDCHNPHGSPTPGALTARSLNATCFECHADKRGPFLWEHAPVREDCSLCHEPHGSPHRGLLTRRTPFLCQQCHMAQFHPGTAQSGAGLPGPARPSGSSSLLGRDCMNCHANVHGSNHPSGAGLTR